MVLDKVHKVQDTSDTTIHDGFSVFLSDFERFNDLACTSNVVM